ncbi:NBS-LRR type resistance protein [Cucumis melo var. makuwa]|uniref:NBS-LRR type resistance protein n=1 Tax=Cucumis melo var. makuwa TaxID=1194695 RepID=A0A5D3DVV3_CUCMM|nr:NBS-LRR type resistance protein [Cucumis melo var. makuwa]
MKTHQHLLLRRLLQSSLLSKDSILAKTSNFVDSYAMELGRDEDLALGLDEFKVGYELGKLTLKHHIVVLTLQTPLEHYLVGHLVAISGREVFVSHSLAPFEHYLGLFGTRVVVLEHLIVISGTFGHYLGWFGTRVVALGHLTPLEHYLSYKSGKLTLKYPIVVFQLSLGISWTILSLGIFWTLFRLVLPYSYCTWALGYYFSLKYHKRSSGFVECTRQSRDPEGCTYQSSDPEGYTYQSTDPEGHIYQSSDPEGCTYQSSDPEGCTYQSSDPEGYTYQ